MAKTVFVADEKKDAIPAVGAYLIDWCVENPGSGLGGATGRSPIDVWSWVFQALDGERRDARDAVVNQEIVYLDEYFGAFPSYYHWAHRNLRVGRGGFASDKVYTPRGCFFESGRVVNSERLEEILSDWEEDWEARTEPGENNGPPPQVWIKPESTHPVLSEIRDSMNEYDRFVREHKSRLQLLGIGVGGAIEDDERAGGHIGFVEYGGAAGDSSTMLVRLAPSTAAANEDDFVLHNADGDVTLEPSNFAVTQGVGTIRSAGELLLMAWGASKSKAIERLFLGQPCAQNPAAWLQHHDNVKVFMDRGAFGDLDAGELSQRGWTVESIGAETVR